MAAMGSFVLGNEKGDIAPEIMILDFATKPNSEKLDKDVDI